MFFPWSTYFRFLDSAFPRNPRVFQVSSLEGRDLGCFGVQCILFVYHFRPRCTRLQWFSYQGIGKDSVGQSHWSHSWYVTMEQNPYKLCRDLFHACVAYNSWLYRLLSSPFSLTGPIIYLSGSSFPWFPVSLVDLFCSLWGIPPLRSLRPGNCTIMSQFGIDGCSSFVVDSLRNVVAHCRFADLRLWSFFFRKMLWSIHSLGI